MALSVEVTRFARNCGNMSIEARAGEVNQYKQRIEDYLTEDHMEALACAIRLGEVSQDSAWVKAMVQQVYERKEQLNPVDRSDLQPIFEEYLGIKPS